MKKLFSALALTAALIFALSSCGGSEACAACTDENGDHLCDGCQAELTKCTDTDSDHTCDICKKVLSPCEDADSNHTCDICKKALSTCADADSNHACDACGATVSACLDADEDHLCDACKSKITDCKDENSDHACDTCQAALSICADANDNHLCDVCSKAISDCIDESQDHFCDVCGIRLGTCADGDKDGLCDVCKEALESEAPTAPSVLGICDLFGNNVENNGFISVASDGRLHIRVTFDMQAKDAYFDLDGFRFYTCAMEGNTCEYEINLPMSKNEQCFYLNLYYEEAVIASYECVVAPFRFYGIYQSTADLSLTNPPTYVEGLRAGEDATLYLAMSAPALPTELYFVETGSLVMAEEPWIFDESNGVYFYTLYIPGDMLFPFGGESGGSRKLAYEIHGENMETVFMTYTVNFYSDPAPGEEPGNNPGGNQGGQSGGMIAIYEVYNEVLQAPVPSNERIFYGWGDGKIVITVRLNRAVESIYFVGDEMYVGEALGAEGEYTFWITFPPAPYTRTGELRLCVWENEAQIDIGYYEYVVAAAEFYGIYTDPSQLDTTARPTSVTVAHGETAVFYIATTGICIDPTQLYIAMGGPNDIQLTPADNPWGSDPVYIYDDYGYPIPVGFYKVEIPAQYMVLPEDQDFGTHKIAFIVEQNDGETLWKTYTVNFYR